MGEPPAEFKALVQQQMLEEKQAKADEEWRQTQAQRQAEAEALAQAKAQAQAESDAVKAQLMADQGATEIAATEPAVPSVEVVDTVASEQMEAPHVLVTTSIRHRCLTCL